MITKLRIGYRIIFGLVLVALICCVAPVSADNVGTVTMGNKQWIIPSKTLNLEDHEVAVIK